MALPVAWIGIGLWLTIGAFIRRTTLWLVPFIIHYGLIALGVGTVTYLGLDAALDVGITALMDRYAEIPPELIDVVRLMGVEDALLIITSMATSCVAIKVTAGVTRWAAQRPAVLKA